MQCCGDEKLWGAEEHHGELSLERNFPSCVHCQREEVMCFQEG